MNGSLQLSEDLGDRLNGWARLGIVLTVLWVLVVLIELRIEIMQNPSSLGLLTDPSNHIKLERFLFGLSVPIFLMWIFLGLKSAWIVFIAKSEGWIVTVAVILLTLPIIMMGFVGLVMLMWVYGVPFYVGAL